MGKELQNVLAMSNPSLATAVATETFGYHVQHLECHKHGKSQTTKISYGPQSARDSRYNPGEDARIARGLTSHCKAGINSLKTVMDDASDYMVHTDCVDEASMWVRRELVKNGTVY